MAATAILDVDGTLVDTNYHHVIAWFRAFRQHGVVAPTWRIHRHIGMGGDQLVAALAGDRTEAEQGDDIRAAEKALYLAMIDEVDPMPCARELVLELRRRASPVILASSAKQQELDHYLDLLDVRDEVDGWTSSADVQATKPAPDLIQAALEKSPGGVAVMVGDSTWDSEAARRAGVTSIAVLTGGFSEQELRDAGAAEVYESLEELIASLDRSALAA